MGEHHSPQRQPVKSHAPTGAVASDTNSESRGHVPTLSSRVTFVLCQLCALASQNTRAPEADKKARTAVNTIECLKEKQLDRSRSACNCGLHIKRCGSRSPGYDTAVRPRRESCLSSECTMRKNALQVICSIPTTSTNIHKHVAYFTFIVTMLIT